MKIAINEIENLNSKLDRQGMCQKYNLTRKELKAVINDYKEGKYPVNNGFIEVDRLGKGMDTLSATSRKPADKSGLNESENISSYSSSQGAGRCRIQDGPFQVALEEPKNEKALQFAIFMRVIAPALKDIAQAISILKDAFTKK